jgi:hypothetical protein
VHTLAARTAPARHEFRPPAQLAPTVAIWQPGQRRDRAEMPNPRSILGMQARATGRTARRLARACCSPAGLALCWLLLASSAPADNRYVVFQTDALRMRIHPDGAVHSVFDLINGVEWTGRPAWFCRALVDGQLIAATSMRLEGERLWFQFGNSGVRAALRIESRQRYLLVVVDAVEGDPSELEFVQLATRPADELLARRILRFNRWCLGILAGAPETRTLGENVKRGRLRAVAYADLPVPTGGTGMAGRSAAIFACRPRELAQVLEEVEHALGIPGGVRSKAHPANRRSYLFVFGMTYENGDRVIRYALDGGFGAILLGHGGWGHYGRKYAVSPHYFPGGVTQLKALVDKIHAADLLAGAHLFATVVPKKGDYTAGKADHRLYQDMKLTLARDIDASAERVETTEPPIRWPETADSRDVLVDGEIFTYAGLSNTEPYGFLGCQRGAYGTQAQAHRVGADLGHLATSLGRFMTLPITSPVRTRRPASIGSLSTAPRRLPSQSGTRSPADNWPC